MLQFTFEVVKLVIQMRVVIDRSLKSWPQGRVILRRESMAIFK